MRCGVEMFLKSFFTEVAPRVAVSIVSWDLAWLRNRCVMEIRGDRSNNEIRTSVVMHH